MRVLRMTDTDLRNKRVLIREDLNVPVQDGVVTSDARIRAALADHPLRAGPARAGVRHVASRAAAGGPGRPALSLAPVAARLSELLGKPVPLRKDWLDGVDCPPGSAVLCENVRFNKGEKKDDDALAARMAALCDVFVMDAFGTAHRAEASTHGVARYARGRLRRAAAGRRAGGARAGAREAGAAAGRDRRRLEGVHQAHRARVAAREGRPADRRRRHRQHLSRRHGLRCRQVAVRGGDARRRAPPHGQGARPRHRDPAADRRGRGARSSPPPRMPTCARCTRCAATR